MPYWSDIGEMGKDNEYMNSVRERIRYLQIETVFGQGKAEELFKT